MPAELTIDESAEALDLDVSDIFRLRESGSLRESSKNRFYTTDIEAAKRRKFRRANPRPIEIPATDVMQSGEYRNSDGVRKNGITVIDPKAKPSTVNTLSERDSLTPRDRTFEEVEKAAAA